MKDTIFFLWEHLSILSLAVQWAQVADKAKAATKEVKKSVEKAADNVSADVSKAAKDLSKEADKTVNAAKDTVDLVNFCYLSL